MDNQEIKSEFVKAFPVLVDELFNNTQMPDMPKTNEWLKCVMEYNVPGGKHTRGLSMVLTYRFLKQDLSPEEIKLSYIMGWCMELTHSSLSISEDIINGSEIRRGKPCWYKVRNNGVTGFNDAILLENIINEILKMYFQEKPYYLELIEFFHNIALKTFYGQSLDHRSSLNRLTDNIVFRSKTEINPKISRTTTGNVYRFTMDFYKRIVKYKTSYYTFYAPVYVAMTMAGLKDSKIYNDTERLCLDFGFLFQAQRDYLDCYGDFEITGEFGRNIQDGKCTWLFVTAMERANLKEKALLQKLYGTANVEDVKNIYKTLKIDEALKDFEDLFRSILTTIDLLPESFPRKIFKNLAEHIYRRV